MQNSRFSHLVAAIPLVLVLSLLSSRSAPPPLVEPPSATLKAVLQSQGTFVAVGEVGAIFISSNGLAWTEILTETLDTLVGVAYGNSRFLTVGDCGDVLTSTNGRDWSELPPLLADGGVTGLAFGQGLFVAVTDLGEVYTSAQGQTWILRYQGTDNGDVMNAVAYCPGAGMFVAVGVSLNSQETDIGCTFYSDTGLDWHRDTKPAGEVYLGVVCVHNSRFIAVGQYTDRNDDVFSLLRTSDNGTSWSQNRNLDSDVEIYGAGYISPWYYAFGEDGALFTSLDTTTWGPLFSGQYDNLYGLTPGNPGVIVGEDSLLILPAPNALWTDLSEIYYLDLGEVAAGTNRFVALGDDNVAWVTTNLVSWRPVRVLNAELDNVELTGITFAAGQFVAVGSFSLGTSNVGVIATSPDGFTWTLRWAALDQFPYDVAYGNNTFVAVGERVNQSTTNHLILTASSPALNWVSAPVPASAAPGLCGVIHGASGFVAVGLRGTLLQSSTGAAWIDRGIPAGSNFVAVAFANGRYVAVGEGETPWYSTNGTNWLEGPPLPAPGLARNEILGADGAFLVAGDGGLLLRSSDGLSWRREYSRTPAQLSGVCFGQGRDVAVGEEGTILVSTNRVDWFASFGLGVEILSSTLAIERTGPGLQVSLSGEPGLRCRVESSDALGAGAWTALTNLFLDGGKATSAVPVQPIPSRLFRAVSE